MVKKKNDNLDIDKGGEPLGADHLMGAGDDSAQEQVVHDLADGDDRRNADRRAAERRKEERRKDAPHIEDPELVSLREKLVEKDEEFITIQAEANSMKDLLQRRQADFENYKKRMVKMQEDGKRFAIKDFATEIIQINDDLLRALEASSSVLQTGATCDESHSSFVQGVSLISKRIEEILEKFGIVEIDAQGKEFDPNFHEAVEIEMDDSIDRDTVTTVHQKGFRIDDLVIRSSKVKVAKAVKKSTTGNDS
ncbi:MAG: nucleotide exchange factor GrpE [Spirochaetae bacterium HGW-Spirochaetae-1]|jgi:molecular chaperone GrpE|nr:MAG: nucleotide exchange factor GrpE [Spirochaetae bacterium HGW-Spirochaetae-1]